MSIMRTDRNQTFDRDGNLLSETTSEVDVTASTNERTIRNQLASDHAANKTHIAIASPTTAQNTAKIKDLCRQNNRFIRLLNNLLDATD